MIYQVWQFCKNENVVLLYDYTGTLKSKGKYIHDNGNDYIIVRAQLPELEELKVILHELEHVRHGDKGFYNSLQILRLEASANKCGISNLISLLANEEIPQPNYLKIAEYLGVDPEYYKAIIYEALQKYQDEY
ncbi:ImmA/IrrE family metallo-endopeptidase [Lactococcus garvieae]|uniref:IrrE N-terminal-like domain-containing protein n=1 Tax=Lactococcus garvieae TaxID=1363 RepID=A0A1I4ID31_9LACT|nr:ImmA/IrrE family metallo-endopeptidase [Lactococcus garvieae]SFL51711.1 protein of unknown function [Lactococcus garvieae]